MKTKILWGELVASFLLLVVLLFARFFLSAEKEAVNVDSSAVSTVVAAFVIVAAIMIQLTGAEKRFVSFSFDVLIIATVGCFLWGLKGVALYALWFSLAVFAFFTIVSVVNAVHQVNRGSTKKDEQQKLLEMHSLISYGLAAKAIFVGLGTVAVEKIFLPMIA